MRKLLTSPNAMSLGSTEQTIYQNALLYVAELSLNLMAVKVENHPEDFLSWCIELHRICQHDVNRDLLEPAQEKPLKKLQEVLSTGVSVCQLKTARVVPWPMFVGFIESVKELHALPERLKLLDYLNKLDFSALDTLIEEDRLAFAGKHTAQHDPSIYQFDVEWFAGTKGAKVFHQLLKSSPESFSEAINCIPDEGEVTLAHYQNFIKLFKNIFIKEDEKPSMIVASRILAAHRPDQFVALTNAKLDVFSQGLGIVKLNSQSFDDYWHELISTIRSSAWWRSEAPTDDFELSLWKNRAILLDLFLFADEKMAENSNYLRLLNKPQKSKASTTKGMKRSQESAEAIVDKALQAEGIPDFIINMRSTIVNSVKDGKSVEQAITLMRNIFG